MSLSAIQGRLLYLTAVFSILLLIILFTPPVISAEPQQEIAARALLGEAERLIECAVPQDALPVLDRVKAEYPGTEAAAFAELRRAECFLFLARPDDAIATAEPIVSGNPGTILACWAQCVVGQALLDKGETLQGLVKLKAVPGMLPDGRDLGPLNQAREMLGRACLKYLESRTDDLDAVEFLGWNRSNTGAKARVLAILSAYRARKGQIEQAKSTLARLESECSSELVEIRWTKAEVALCELGKAAASGMDSVEAANILAALADSSQTGDHQAAKAALALARRHLRKKEVNEAVILLQASSVKFAGTDKSAEMLYELGNALFRQGKPTEGVLVLKQLLNDYPRSGYAATTLYCIGNYTSSGREDAMQALSTLAEGQYNRRWKGLALWKLGTLLKSTDRMRARQCYSNAIGIFQQILDENKEDLEGWREMLFARISLIQEDMRNVMDAVEVSQ